MSGETEVQPSAWNVDTLNAHLVEILAERDLRHQSQLAAVKVELVARLDAIDKATNKFEANQERFPTEVDKQVGHLKELVTEKFTTVDERFVGVALQFRERDTHSEHEARDNKDAVAAAFTAQKETLNKQADLFKSTTDALDSKIGDDRQTINKLDSRLTTIESRGVVGRETQSQNNWVIGAVLGVIGTLISLVSLIVVLGKLG